MFTILPFLEDESAFGPEEMLAMSQAFDEVCHLLGVNGDNGARKTIAVRIIELARHGKPDVNRLSNRVLREAIGHRQPDVGG